MDYPAKLVNTDLEALKQKQKLDFTNLEQELLGMRVVLADTPTSENLLKLFETTSKSRAYFERSAEIFRSYLKYTNTISLLRYKAEEDYKLIEAKAQKQCMDADINMYKNCKSGDERAALVKQYIPEGLSSELVLIKNIESMATTNLRIIKSYMDSFKSVREDILAQLAIIKQLVALGGIKIDVETIKAMNSLDRSFGGSSSGYQESYQGEFVPETSYEEGIVNLGE